MRCPVCNVTLTTAERFGVEIDYCPKCWGVWLDRGELNTIFARQAAHANAPHDPVVDAPYQPESIHRNDTEADFGNIENFTWKSFLERR